MKLYANDRLDCILAECSRAENARRDAGLDPFGAMVQFVVRRRKSPANWDSCRVITGVVGRVIGELRSPHPCGEKGEWLVDVRVTDVRRALGPRPCGERTGDATK